MGMRTPKTAMHPMKMPYSTAVKEVNQGEAFNQMILNAVLDLANKDPAVKTIVVWKIESKTAGLDVELIRHKLISGLVNLNRFTVVAREKLAELLKEHSLSLSGAIDKENAVELGHLLGVEAFIDGYAAITGNRFQLSLKLVETKTGAIIWATTVEQEIY